MTESRRRLAVCVCEECGQMFRAVKSTARFHSMACHKRNYRRRRADELRRFLAEEAQRKAAKAKTKPKGKGVR